MKINIIKPNLSHIAKMQSLVKDDVANGIILYRSDEEVANMIRSYHLAVNEEDDEILGYCALYIYSSSLAEIRSLIVKQAHRQKGIATMLLNSSIEEARLLKIQKILTLTYKASLFQRLDFKIIEKSLLPNQKIWADCIKCKRFPICDEIALIKTL